MKWFFDCLWIIRTFYQVINRFLRETNFWCRIGLFRWYAFLKKRPLNQFHYIFAFNTRHFDWFNASLDDAILGRPFNLVLNGLGIHKLSYYCMQPKLLICIHPKKGNIGIIVIHIQSPFYVWSFSYRVNLEKQWDFFKQT